MKGMITGIQHFSIHDGPGVRTTVFFKGCNLRCWWCHNPETWFPAPQIQFFAGKCIACGRCVQVCPRAADGKTALHTAHCTACGVCADTCYAQALQKTGKWISQEELMFELCKDLGIYRRSGGGVTFSGGEPLLQATFLEGVLDACCKAGIHTAIETAGCVPWEAFCRCMPDLVYADIKCLNSEKHFMATGKDNTQILENILKLSGETLVELILRIPVVPGFNDNIDDVRELAQWISLLPRKHQVELLPFHGYCVGKYESLGIPFRGAGLSTPPEERISRWRKVFAEYGCQVKGWDYHESNRGI